MTSKHTSIILLFSLIFFSCKNPDNIKFVKIDKQIWMSENLNVNKFNNGDTIPETKTVSEWKDAIKNRKPAWCYYENSIENGKKYGKLYNWFAVTDPRGIAPNGWHIPTKDEWLDLRNFLGGEKLAGEKLKSKQGWDEEGNGTDVFKFNGLPGGYMDGDTGDFNNSGSLLK